MCPKVRIQPLVQHKHVQFMMKKGKLCSKKCIASSRIPFSVHLCITHTQKLCCNEIFQTVQGAKYEQNIYLKNKVSNWINWNKQNDPPFRSDFFIKKKQKKQNRKPEICIKMSDKAQSLKISNYFCNTKIFGYIIRSYYITYVPRTHGTQC